MTTEPRPPQMQGPLHPKRKLYKLIRLPFVGRETITAEGMLEGYGFRRKISHVIDLFWTLVFLGLCSLVIWLVVRVFDFERVPWSQAATPVLSLGVAIVAYRQWRAARYEISIDKYYDRLEIANKRLEALEADTPLKEDMHAFAELDKLEYVLVKYEYGYISTALALRALKNFLLLCRDREGFSAKAAHWVKKAAYLEVTEVVVQRVIESCRPPSCPADEDDRPIQ